jgi:hypothetical protein
MSSAHNAHSESGLWSNLRRKDGCVVAFIVCGLIASSSGLVLQMAGHDANIDGRSVIAAMPLNPATLLSTVVSPGSPATSSPDSRQGSASPSNSAQTTPLNAIPTAVTATRQATTELSQQPVAASHSPQTAPLNAIPTAATGSTREATTGLPQQPVAASNSPQTAPFNETSPAVTAPAVTASTGEETTGLPQWPAAASNDSQKPVRHSNQRSHGRYDAAAWGRYAPSWESTSKTAQGAWARPSVIELDCVENATLRTSFAPPLFR